MIHTSAVFDPTGAYRYQLWRQWNVGPVDGWRVAAFIMLNPSTADAEKDDPTVRRCIKYAQEWGYDALVVCNIFALRSTDPAKLYETLDPIGQDNDAHIADAVRNAALTVCAWGAHGSYMKRGHDVYKNVKAITLPHYLKMTLSGQPGHPLYLKGNLRPTPWVVWTGE